MPLFATLLLSGSLAASQEVRAPTIEDLDPSVRARVAAWIERDLELDRHWVLRMSSMFGEDPLHVQDLDQLTGGVRLVRRLGFDVASYGRGEQVGVGGYSLLALVTAGDQSVARILVNYGRERSYNNVRTKELLRNEIADVWPGTYDEAPRSRFYPATSFSYSWTDLEALHLQETAKSRRIGSAPGVEVPEELAESFMLLSDPFGYRPTFGTTGGIAGRILEGRRATNELVEAGRWDLLRMILRSWNPEGRVYAADVLSSHKQLTVSDAHAVRFLRSVDIPLESCAGGCLIDRSTARDHIPLPPSDETLLPAQLLKPDEALWSEAQIRMAHTAPLGFPRLQFLVGAVEGEKHERIRETLSLALLRNPRDPAAFLQEGPLREAVQGDIDRAAALLASLRGALRRGEASPPEIDELLKLRGFCVPAALDLARSTGESELANWVLDALGVPELPGRKRPRPSGGRGVLDRWPLPTELTLLARFEPPSASDGHAAALVVERYLAALDLHPTEREALALGLRRTPAWTATSWDEWWLMAGEPWAAWWSLVRSEPSADARIAAWKSWLRERYPDAH